MRLSAGEMALRLDVIVLGAVLEGDAEGDEAVPGAATWPFFFVRRFI